MEFHYTVLSTFVYISNCPQKVTENNLLDIAIGNIYSDKIVSSPYFIICIKFGE